MPQKPANGVTTEGTLYDAVMPEPFDWKWVLPLLGPCVAVVIYFLNTRRARKALAYDYREDRFWDLTKSPGSAFQLTFQGNQVNNASVIHLTIKNTGRAAIPKTEFEDAIFINVDAGSVLSNRVSECQPESLQPICDRHENTITIGKLLLNSGDSITMLIVATGFKDLKVSARIAGVKTIERYKGMTESPIVSPWLLGTLILSSLGGIRAVALKGRQDFVLGSNWFALGISSTAIFATVLMHIKRRKTRR